MKRRAGRRRMGSERHAPGQLESALRSDGGRDGTSGLIGDGAVQQLDRGEPRVEEDAERLRDAGR
jgi:hypothetical protein